MGLRSLILLLSFSAVLGSSSCIKEREADTGFLDIKGTTWEISGNFFGQNLNFVTRFNPDGKGTIGNLSITWIQSRNEILFLTSEGTRFETRLISAGQMRGSYYLNNAEVPTNTIQGRRIN